MRRQVDRTTSRRREAHAGRLRLRSRMLGAHVRATRTHWTLYLTTARSNASADVQPTRASTTSLLHRSARARCAGRASAGQCRSSRVRSAPRLTRSANESGCPCAPLWLPVCDLSMCRPLYASASALLSATAVLCVTASLHTGE